MKRKILIALLWLGIVFAYLTWLVSGVSSQRHRRLVPADGTAVHTKMPVAVVQEPQDSLTLEQRDSLVVRTARRWRVNPTLALAVSHVENWRAKPEAVSPAGAIGLMQIMPVHLNAFPECAPAAPLAGILNVQIVLQLADLYVPEINVCYGIRILGNYLRRHENRERALAAYNGAVTDWKAALYIRQVAMAQQRLIL